MAIQKFKFAVTKFVEVTIDTDNFDEEFWNDFNSSITDRGGEDFEYLAEHIAWNHVQGDTVFVEGVGNLLEMGVKSREYDSDVEPM